MLAPTSPQRPWKTLVEPVKWMPARSGWLSAALDTSAPWPGTMLITPSGRPAACSICIHRCAAKVWVRAGFQTTVLPISAGAVGRLPAVAVKVKGVIA